MEIYFFIKFICACCFFIRKSLVGICEANTSSRNHRLSNKKVQCQVLGTSPRAVSQNNTSYRNALGYPPELNGKTQLLKTPHTLSQDMDTSSLLTRKLPPSWLAFMVLEGAVQAAGGKPSTALPSWEPISSNSDQQGRRRHGATASQQ